MVLGETEIIATSLVHGQLLMSDKFHSLPAILILSISWSLAILLFAPYKGMFRTNSKEFCFVLYCNCWHHLVQFHAGNTLAKVMLN